MSHRSWVKYLSITCALLLFVTAGIAATLKTAISNEKYISHYLPGRYSGHEEPFWFGPSDPTVTFDFEFYSDFTFMCTAKGTLDEKEVTESAFGKWAGLNDGRVKLTFDNNKYRIYRGASFGEFTTEATLGLKIDEGNSPFGTWSLVLYRVSETKKNYLFETAKFLHLTTYTSPSGHL